MIVLSRELYETSLGLQARADMGGVPPGEASEIADELRALAAIAKAMEGELQVHRLLRAGEVGRKMVEELAASTALPPMSDGNVIRPDFGRRP
jgi:hypothetical protein